MKSIKSVFFPAIEDAPGRVHHRSRDTAREMQQEGCREGGCEGSGSVGVNIHRVNQGSVRSGFLFAHQLKNKQPPPKKKPSYQCLYNGTGISVLFILIHPKRPSQ